MNDLKNSIAALKPKCGSTVFITVDGHRGSGKTTFAKKLSEKIEATLIQTDDFAGWDNPLNWSGGVIEKVFIPISRGATSLSYQPASWAEDHHPEPIDNQSVTPIIILEGVSSSRKEFDEYLSLRIFIDTPKDCLLYTSPSPRD